MNLPKVRGLSFPRGFGLICKSMVRAAPLHVPRPTLLVLVAALLLLLPGCIVRRLKIVRPGVSSSAKLQTASLQQLVEQLRVWDKQIRTVNATVDLEPSLGSVLKGEISELKEVRGFVLIRKPQMIRMIGLYPVVRNRAFDMVSDGDQFKLYVPAKDKFIVGNNHQKKPSDRRLENLRPQHIFEALVVRPPNDGERLVLENDTDELHANYILHVLKEQNGLLLLVRNVWFDRVHLRVVRQQIFDDQGDMISDTRYDDYQEVEGIPFPKRFLIMRPKDEYGIKLKVKKVKLNAPLGDEKFVLAQPSGSKLMDISSPDRGATTSPSAGPSASPSGSPAGGPSGDSDESPESPGGHGDQ